MSVQAVGGANTALLAQSMQAAAKPETTEKAGAPDHDGDSDDAAVKVTLSKQS